LHFDINQALRDVIAALERGRAPVWAIFLAIFLFMSPLIIPAASKAIAEHRKLTHTREQNLLKIRNSVADRKARRATRGDDQ
jgi:hypothetical protein